LQQPGDPATLSITKADSEIRIGDRVMPNAEEELTINYFPRSPEESIKAILSVCLTAFPKSVNITWLSSIKALKRYSGRHELDIYQRGKVVRDPYSSVKNDTVNLLMKKLVS